MLLCNLKCIRKPILRRCWYAAKLVYGIPTTEVNKTLVVGTQGCFISAPYQQRRKKLTTCISQTIA